MASLSLKSKYTNRTWFFRWLVDLFVPGFALKLDYQAKELIPISIKPL